MLALIAAACTIGGAGAYPLPDTQCTPGAYQALTKRQVCVHRDRPPLKDSDRALILSQYGVPRWSGRDGELDHRVPFALGGLTTPANIWPEPGSIPNEKDRLEFYVYDRVCFKGTMRVTTARRIFLGNWVKAYHRYISAATPASAPGRTAPGRTLTDVADVSLPSLFT